MFIRLVLKMLTILLEQLVFYVINFSFHFYINILYITQEISYIIIPSY